MRGEGEIGEVDQGGTVLVTLLGRDPLSGTATAAWHGDRDSPGPAECRWPGSGTALSDSEPASLRVDLPLQVEASSSAGEAQALRASAWALHQPSRLLPLAPGYEDSESARHRRFHAGGLCKRRQALITPLCGVGLVVVVV